MYFKILSKFIFAIFILSASTALAGGGTKTGDGFPKQYLPIHSLDWQKISSDAHFPEVIRNLVRVSPTLAHRLFTTASKFGLQGNSFQFLEAIGKDPYQYAFFSAQWKPGHHQKQFPEVESATIVVYQDFFELSHDLSVDSSEHPTQAHVLIHELVHVGMTQMDEEMTVKVADLIYQLSLPGHVPTSDELSFLKLWIPGAEYFHNIIQFYDFMVFSGANRGQECSQIVLSEPIQIGDQKIRFPYIPEELRRLLDSDPFFRVYRDTCFDRTEEGKTLLDLPSQYTPAGHPARFLRYGLALKSLIEAIVKQELTLTISSIDARDFDPEIRDVKWIERLSQITSERIEPYTSAYIARWLPGFTEWQEVAHRSESNAERTYSSLQNKVTVPITTDDLSPLILKGVLSGSIPLFFSLRNLTKVEGCVVDGDRPSFTCDFTFSTWFGLGQPKTKKISLYLSELWSEQVIERNLGSPVACPTRQECHALQPMKPILISDGE